MALGESLIPLINRLQDIFSQVTVDLKLTLPQVAVIGSQSSGKSSVLESLVGRDFLPRGSDIVTRRPLVLQLVKTNSNSSNNNKSSSSNSSSGPQQPAEEWGEFLHIPGRVFTDFGLIRQEIQAETDRVTGSNKNVSDKPIRLKIYSPHVLTMTLVDLPGMTKVPVGDQPSNIEARIRELVLDHISPPSVIILAVSPANADLANSDALQLARMVDPVGERTIGVVTKLDIMDRGTSAARILSNQHIPLQLGYIGVVNRCQEDIVKSKCMADARRAEDAFFSSKPEYREVASQCGIANLARRLNVLLVEHIRAMLPELRHAIHGSLESRTAQLHALGDPLPYDSKSAKGAFLLQLLCDYSERFAAMLEGRHQDLSTKRLSGGARIRAVFTGMYARAISELSPMKDVSDDAILTVIKNGAGVSGNLIVPHEPFELLMRRSVMSLLPPALACKEAIYSELLVIAEQACPAEAGRFPGLQRQLATCVLDLIRSSADPAERMINALIECEHDFINCDHPDFIGGRGAIRAVMQERALRAAGGAARGKDGSETGKEGPSHSAPAGPVSGLLSRNRSSSRDAADPHGGRGLGLKSLPEPSPFSSDELLTRTRRQHLHEPSDSECGTLAGMPHHTLFQQHHQHTLYPNGSSYLSLGVGGGAHSDHGMVLGAGRETPERASSSGSAPHSSSHGHSHSWFSWFSRGSDGTQAGTAGDGGMLNFQGQELQALGGRIDGLREHRHGSHTGDSGLLHEQDEIEVEVIRKLVDSYFAIVQRNLQDGVPKAIMHFMVNNTKRGLQQHLIQQLYREDLLEDLLSEREDVTTQRRDCKEAISVLQAAMQALEELPNSLHSVSGTPGQATTPSSSTSPLPPFFNALPPLPSSNVDRSSSTRLAARVATTACASLTGHNESARQQQQQQPQLIS